MASFSSRSNRRIMACTPWLAPSVRYRKSGLQGYPSLSSMPCKVLHNAQAALSQSMALYEDLNARMCPDEPLELNSIDHVH